MMKTLAAALALGLSVSTVALAGPFNMGSPQHPTATHSGAMTASGSPAADLGGFTERDTGYRRDGSMDSHMPGPDKMTGSDKMTSPMTSAPHAPGWTGPEAWNS